ncbi:pyruvate decarboxylase [Xylariaceae sp. FL0804]|nr:pyruvate decarboxylase [Xylariaceae sp. FL0804]
MSELDIRTRSLRKPVKVAEYLFTRLRQMGIRSVHGLPGDYNLVSLDYLPAAGLRWVGNCNELNAAYAADGYARVRGMGAIMTTFGVGELSALNGLAGAYSEMVPVVHVVGCPSTASQRGGALLHHTLGNGDFGVFAGMSAHVSCAVARLADPADAAAQVDHALRECYVQSRPVYIMLPTDLVEREVEGERLDEPIDLGEPPNDEAKEDYVVDVIRKALQAAKSPIVLVDACAIRHRVVDEVRGFIDKTKLPVFVTPMGKGAFDEDHPSFGGVYAGNASEPEIKRVVEASDLVLSVGALKSDFNTAGFSYRLSQLNTIDLHSTYCAVGYAEYPAMRMRGVLRKLAERIEVGQLAVARPPAHQAHDAAGIAGGDAIRQSWFWHRVDGFLRPGDIVVTETGTANFGIWETRFPRGVTALNQTLWGSIGWAVGACQGAALAATDDAEEHGGKSQSGGGGSGSGGGSRRTILFEGDGSLQLTAQEISTMIRHNLNVILFTICNDGYTIERFIHGMDAAYNDVAAWRYKDLVTVFGGSDEATGTRKHAVRTAAELEALLTDPDFSDRPGLRFVELYMPREDAPRSLQMTAEASAKTNSGGG